MHTSMVNGDSPTNITFGHHPGDHDDHNPSGEHVPSGNLTKLLKMTHL